MNKDFYQILDVLKTASADDIKKAYKKKSVEYHPDKSPENTEKFKAVQEAYEVLGDSHKRASYDRHGNMNFRTRGTTTSSGFSGFDIFSEIFGGGQVNYRGRDIQIKVEIEFLDVLKGYNKPLKVKKREKCNTCSGNGYSSFENCSFCQGSGVVVHEEGPFSLQVTCSVCKGSGKTDIVNCDDCKGSAYSKNEIETTINLRIPVGIISGSQLKLPGEGEPSLKGGKPGDLIVFVIIKDHPYFVRENQNLLLEVPVSYTQLVLGDTIKIPTLEESVNIKIPSGSQPNIKIRLKDKGFPTGRGNFGDLFCILKLEAPKELTDDYKAILNQLSELEKKYLTPRIKKWQKDQENN